MNVAEPCAAVTTWSFCRLLSELNMASNGWDIAMGRIDAEFDIPQSLASSLVRNIAANNFRLPPTQRDRASMLPEEVIVRVETIVRTAYLDAGEDVGGKTLREHLWQQALDGRRSMIANGELISREDFRIRLDVNERRVDALLAVGSVFAVEVDEVEYFPALLVDSALNQERLQAICRIIVPAPSMSRLDFLTSQHGSIRDRSPLEMLEDERDFQLLRKAATAWAAEYSRTAVKIYGGKQQTEPAGAEPLYVAMAEVDPRMDVWKRATEALNAPGYERPVGRHPEVRQFSLFVVRCTAGDSESTPEACVRIEADGEFFIFDVVAGNGAIAQPERIPAGSSADFVETAKHVIAHLAK
jgi:hypothetical protein